MRIDGQTFSPDVLERIKQVVDEDPQISRRALSKRVCNLLGWRHPDGRPKDMSCRKALSRLQKAGRLSLPDAVQVLAFRKPTPPKEFDRPPISCSLQELGRVTLVLIDNHLSEEAGIWKSLMRLHYLGDRLFCAGLRYLVHSTSHGWLGALAFGPAAFRVSVRDEFIGWGEQERLANLNLVIGNSRFLLHPDVRVPHLASHVLGMAMRRVKRDWLSRYGKEPLLVETFVDQNRFTGACYRAANWTHIGTTAGRGRQDSRHQADLPPKGMYVYPLHKKWRELLGGSLKEEITPVRDWAEEEWGGASLGDARLVQRLISLGGDRYARPQANIPQTCGSRAKAKAAYRFLDHERATLENLLAHHIEATTRRVAKEKVVLAIQDTTTLNYSTHPATENLGPIMSAQNGVVGLILHGTLAVNADGTPLGLLDAQCWARDPAEFGKKAKRHSLPIEQKESNKWLVSFKAAAVTAAACPNTTVVSVGDREADVYELFALADRTPNAPLLLVRAQHNRKLMEEQGLLSDQLTRSPKSGVQELEVPRKSNRPARVARLAIRHSKVILAPPKGKKDGKPVTAWAILAEEKDPMDSPCYDQVNCQACFQSIGAAKLSVFDPTAALQRSIEILRWSTVLCTMRDARKHL